MNIGRAAMVSGVGRYEGKSHGKKAVILEREMGER